MGLHHASSDWTHGAVRYEAQRARAFRRALDGSQLEALDLLNEGWGDDWPEPSSYAADIAHIRLETGDPEGAFEALRLAVQSGERLEPRVPELLLRCLESAPGLRLRALRLAAEGRRPVDQGRLVLSVVRTLV